MSGKKPRWRNGVSDASKRTSPRDSSHCRGTGRCWTQRPPPSSSEPGTKVASGIPVVARRRPHRLRLGANDAGSRRSARASGRCRSRSGPSRPTARRRSSRGRSRRQRELWRRPRRRRRGRRAAPRPAARAAASIDRADLLEQLLERQDPAEHLDRARHLVGAALRAFPCPSAARPRAARGRAGPRPRVRFSTVVREHCRARRASIRPPARGRPRSSIADDARCRQRPGSRR